MIDIEFKTWILQKIVLPCTQDPQVSTKNWWNGKFHVKHIENPRMKITSCSLKEFQIVWLLLSLRQEKSEIFCFHFTTKALQTFSTMFVWNFLDNILLRRKIIAKIDFKRWYHAFWTHRTDSKP